MKNPSRLPVTNNVINNGALSLFLAYDDQLTRKNHEFISGPNPDFTLGEFPVIVQKRPAESSHMMRTHAALDEDCRLNWADLERRLGEAEEQLEDRDFAALGSALQSINN